MYTKCPACKKTHTLTLPQLRASRGLLRCRNCSVIFNALEFISETSDVYVAENLSTQNMPWDKPNEEPISVFWSMALLIAVLLFVAQVVYFEGYAFSQNSRFRPGLEKICHYLDCKLPVYKNPDEFALLHGSFTPLPDHKYMLRAIFTNQAAFTQALPNITLNLLDYTGRRFTHRVFQPQDYLPETAVATNMIPGATTEISLIIAAPKTGIGGYTFELTY